MIKMEGDLFVLVLKFIVPGLPDKLTIVWNPCFSCLCSWWIEINYIFVKSSKKEPVCDTISFRVRQQRGDVIRNQTRVHINTLNTFAVGCLHGCMGEQDIEL
jgi:hypothetical protein